MRVYPAAWFADKGRIAKYASELQALGINISARWFDEIVKPQIQLSELTEEYAIQTAVSDIEDMYLADVMILFTPSAEDLETAPVRSWSRGGRHFESGLFYSLVMLDPQNRTLVICGPRENIFHSLNENSKYPAILQFDDWTQTKAYLAERHAHETKELEGQLILAN